MKIAIATIAAGPVCSLHMPAIQPSTSISGIAQRRFGDVPRASAIRYGTNSASVMPKAQR